MLYPLSFFSNIFTTPATLPGWLRAFVDINPVSHLVTAVRALMAGATPEGRGLAVARLQRADRDLRAAVGAPAAHQITTHHPVLGRDQ